MTLGNRNPKSTNSLFAKKGEKKATNSAVKQRRLNLFGGDKGLSDNEGSVSRKSKSRSRLVTSGLQSAKQGFQMKL